MAKTTGSKAAKNASKTSLNAASVVRLLLQYKDRK